MRFVAAALGVFLAIAGGAAFAVEQNKILTIGTAGARGVYYPAGGAICRFLNREEGASQACSVKVTSGTVYNLKALREGKLDLALAQTDWIYHAVHGIGDFRAEGPDENLRTLFTLYTETFTVLVRADSGITSVEELPDQRVGIPDEGSGMRATAEEFLHAEGWSRDSFAALRDFDPDKQEDALCNGKVDAVLFLAGHPNGGTQKATHSCLTRLLSVEGRAIDRMIAKNPYYVKVTLPGGLYPGSPKPVDTFGVKAAVVASARMDEETAYRVVKAVFDNLETLHTLHPVFSRLDETLMSREGFIAPIHPGALRYFREAGLRP